MTPTELNNSEFLTRKECLELRKENQELKERVEHHKVKYKELSAKYDYSLKKILEKEYV